MLKKNLIVTIFAGFFVVVLFVVTCILVNIKQISRVDDSALALQQQQDALISPGINNNPDDANTNAAELTVVDIDVADEKIAALLLLDYQEALDQIKGPENLVSLLSTGFTVKDRQSLVALEPAEFYQLKAGSDVDMAVFAAHSLKQAGMEAGVIRFDYRLPTGAENSALAVIWRDVASPKYMLIEDRAQIYQGTWSFKAFVQARASMLGGEAIRYTYFPADILDLQEPQAPFEWGAL